MSRHTQKGPLVESRADAMWLVVGGWRLDLLSPPPCLVSWFPSGGASPSQVTTYLCIKSHAPHTGWYSIPWCSKARALARKFTAWWITGRVLDIPLVFSVPAEPFVIYYSLFDGLEIDLVLLSDFLGIMYIRILCDWVFSMVLLRWRWHRS